MSHLRMKRPGAARRRPGDVLEVIARTVNGREIRLPQLAPVWERVLRGDDPPIDVNRRLFAPPDLPQLLKDYDICLDDHSYLPTEFIQQCDRLKHIVFLGTGAASYMNVGELARRGIRV